MAENSKIEWTDHTFNPWRGCTKVSPACQHCYAEAQAKRNPFVLGMWGSNGTRVVASEAQWKLPLKWDREAKAAGVRRRVFCASMADVFEGWSGPMVNSVGDQLFVSPGTGGWVPNQFEHMRRPLTMDDVRLRLLRTFVRCKNLDLLCLTKRPENVMPMLANVSDMVDTYEAEELSKWWASRVWLGTTVEDRKHGTPRINLLRRIPAAVRFLSIEPLLEDLGSIDLTGIHWVIVGGESGHGARPMHPYWVRILRDQCVEADVPFFFKQWGEWCDWSQTTDHVAAKIGSHPDRLIKLGKKSAGRLLDGREWSEFPKVVQS